MSRADQIERIQLAITDALLREKRLQQERGEVARIYHGSALHHITYFSLLAGKGSSVCARLPTLLNSTVSQLSTLWRDVDVQGGASRSLTKLK